MPLAESNALRSLSRLDRMLGMRGFPRLLLAAAIFGGVPPIVSAQQPVDLRLPVIFSEFFRRMQVNPVRSDIPAVLIFI